MTASKPMIVTLALIISCTIGCRAEVYHGLEERHANEMIVVLEQHGIEADKQPDANDKAAWVVTVPEGSRVQAWSVLKAQGLPKPKSQGFGQFYPSKGLIPTANEEHVLLQYATAQELRRGLLAVDGVVDVHVNLVMPKRARVRLSRDQPETTRASVLVKYRAEDKTSAPPLTEAQVKQLIIGGVRGIEAKHIAVVLTPDAHKPILDPKLQQVGPVAVATRSKTSLQFLISVLCAIILVLGGVLAFVIVRRRTPDEVAS